MSERKYVSDEAWERIKLLSPWAIRETWEEANRRYRVVTLTLGELVALEKPAVKATELSPEDVERLTNSPPGAIQVVPDVLGKLRQGLQEMRKHLFDHGLHGPQATTYVELQREHAEPVLDAVDELLNDLLGDASVGSCREMSADVASDVGSDVGSQRAPYSTMPKLAGDMWTNPRLGNRYT